MKFDPALSDHENLRARRDYHRQHFKQRTAYRKLNSAERHWLMALNAQLTQLEEQYLPIMKAKQDALQTRVADPDDWIQDFNLELVIIFYLRKDDREYEEGDDNILMKIMENSFDADEPDWEWGFGTTENNYAESLDVFEGEHHCWLYHSLYDHVGLDWQDLLRIGEIGVEAKIEEQSGMLLTDCGISASGIRSPNPGMQLTPIHVAAVLHRLRKNHHEVRQQSE